MPDGRNGRFASHLGWGHAHALVLQDSCTPAESAVDRARFGKLATVPQINTNNGRENSGETRGQAGVSASAGACIGVGGRENARSGLWM